MSRETTITTEIDDLTHRSHTGLLGFGDYVTHLVALGVESYHVDYLRRASTYHLSSGETHEVSHHHVPAGAVAEAWSADRVHEAVRGAQRGEVLYPQFVALTRAAGCVGYSVWIAGRHVRYFGRRGETLVEPFPAPDAAPHGLRAPVELVRRLYESMLRRDAAAVLERFDPGIVIEQSPEVPWGGHYEGHDGAKAFLARLGGAIRSTPVVERLVDAGEHVVAIGRTQGTTLAGGEAFDVPFAHVWTIRGGRVVAARFYIDNPTILAAHPEAAAG